jgi:hypothetical protein
MTTVQIGADALVLCAAIAEEIRGFGARLEEVAGTLIMDERVVMSHLDTLQAFDFIAQQASESARLLDCIAFGGNVGAAIDDVRLTAVQARLRAALG